MTGEILIAENGKQSAEVTIRALDLQRVPVRVIGETPLIVHKFSEKNRDDLWRPKSGKATPKGKGSRVPRDPQQEYQDAMYYLDDGSTGFPARGFKAAIVGACRQFEGMVMVTMKVAIRVNGVINKDFEDLVPIEGEPKMREDIVRLANGNADIRFRPIYWPWEAEFMVTFNRGLVSVEQLYNLINAAGMGGIGEFRPSSPKSFTGTYGCFYLAR